MPEGRRVGLKRSALRTRILNVSSGGGLPGEGSEFWEKEEKERDKKNSNFMKTKKERGHQSTLGEAKKIGKKSSETLLFNGILMKKNERGEKEKV